MAEALSIALLALTVAASTALLLRLFELAAARFAAMPRRPSAGRPSVPIPVAAGLVVAAVRLAAGSQLRAPLTPPA